MPLSKRKDHLQRLLLSPKPAGIALNEHIHADGAAVFRISTPWQELLGRQSVCTRDEIVDSSGNHIEAGPVTIYVLEGSRIVDSRSDDLCLIRDYGPLQPVKQ